MAGDERSLCAVPPPAITPKENRCRAEHRRFGTAGSMPTPQLDAAILTAIAS